MLSECVLLLPDGVAVLQAGDPAVAELASLCDGTVLFYALEPGLPVIDAHCAGGGRALFLRANHVVVAGAMGETPLFSLAALHPAMSGKPLLQPLYVLASVGVALALDIPPELIRAAMDTCVSLPTSAIQANY